MRTIIIISYIIISLILIMVVIGKHAPPETFKNADFIGFTTGVVSGFIVTTALLFYMKPVGIIVGLILLCVFSGVAKAIN